MAEVLAFAAAGKAKADIELQPLSPTSTRFSLDSSTETLLLSCTQLRTELRRRSGREKRLHREMLKPFGWFGNFLHLIWLPKERQIRTNGESLVMKH